MSVRYAAQAGRFYPADAATIRVEVDRYLDTAHRANPAQTTLRAVLLPHAGWFYCGSVIGATLADVVVPNEAIILGPNHTGRGAACSVAPHSAWALPGDEVPIATTTRDRLLAAVPSMIAEPEAHASEHGCEVLLPFLRRLNPQLAVVPLVLGHLPYIEVAALGAALARWLAEDTPPLLVISSDMHHFADDTTNRRLDRLALDAFETGNPQRLWQVVGEHGITMCGVRPAIAVLSALHDDDATAAPPRVVAYATSGDVSGDRQRVVGYAGAHLP
jgi:AmmeMemoRadiSam system protein B